VPAYQYIGRTLGVNPSLRPPDARLLIEADHAEINRSASWHGTGFARNLFRISDLPAGRACRFNRDPNEE